MKTQTKGEKILRALGCKPVDECGASAPAKLIPALANVWAALRRGPFAKCMWYVPNAAAWRIVEDHAAGNRDDNPANQKTLVGDMHGGQFHYQAAGTLLWGAEAEKCGDRLIDGRNRMTAQALSGFDGVWVIHFDVPLDALSGQMTKNDDEIYQFILRTVPAAIQQQHTDGKFKQMTAVVGLLTHVTQPRRTKRATPVSGIRMRELFLELMPNLGQMVELFPSKCFSSKSPVQAAFVLGSYHLSSAQIAHAQAILVEDATPLPGYEVMETLRQTIDKIYQLKQRTTARKSAGDTQMYRQLFALTCHALHAIVHGQGHVQQLPMIVGEPSEVAACEGLLPLPLKLRKAAPEFTDWANQRTS